MTLSKRIRFEVFKRDRFTCQYCGRRPPEVMLEVDHVHPRVEGGSDDQSNLTTACFDCNRGKGKHRLGDVAPAIDELELLGGIQDMLERAAALKQSAAAAEAQRAAEDNVIRTIRRWYAEALGDDSCVEDSSLRMFLRRLSVDAISEAITAAERMLDRKPYSPAYYVWKYFCGACWTMIREHDAAAGSDAS